MSNEPYILVDLDGTLAHYAPSSDSPIDNIGLPVPEMEKRVIKWLRAGMEVRIFTARVSGEVEALRDHTDNGTLLLVQADSQRAMIESWCLRWFGRRLKVQCWKCSRCIEIWDDRAVRVIANTGRRSF